MPRKSPAKAVADLRDRIDELNTERRQIQTAPVSRDEAEQALDAYLERQANQYDARRITDKLSTRAVVDSLGAAQNVEGFAAYFFADAIKARLMGGLDAKGGMSATERADALRRIDSDLFACETQEEQAITEAETNGTPIERRADADPRAVLQISE